MTDQQTHLERLERAARVVVDERFGSVVAVQRKLFVTFAAAAGLLDELERYGVVGPARRGRTREVLVSQDELAEVVVQIRGVA